MFRLIAISFFFLYSCAIKHDPMSDGIIAPFPAHAPKAPTIARGNHLPADLQGVWLAQRTSGEVKVWSRLSFSDDMRLISQIWGDRYDLGAFEEKIVGIVTKKDGDLIVVDVVLQMTGVTPVTHSFINNYKVGTTRECHIEIDTKSVNPSLSRHCAERIKDNLPPIAQRPKFYKYGT